MYCNKPDGPRATLAQEINHWACPLATPAGAHQSPGSQPVLHLWLAADPAQIGGIGFMIYAIHIFT